MNIVWMIFSQFTQLTNLTFLRYGLTNSKTAHMCFQVMGYVNLVAIFVIFQHNWVP